MTMPKTVSRARVVAEARGLIDTPIFHRGRNRAGGVDCLGLVILTGVGSGAMDEPDLGPWAFYGRIPNPEWIVGGLNRFAVPIAVGPAACDTASPGDILALSWGLRDAPMHLAILAEYEGRRTIIHAFPIIAPPRVREMGFSADWPDRVCGSWRFPRVAG